MNVAEIQKTTEHKMQKSLETLKADFAKVRTGRAHTGLLDHIQVDYYGAMVPLAQVAQVGLSDARTITVQPCGCSPDRNNGTLSWSAACHPGTASA